MKTKVKPRSDGNTAISVSLGKSLLDKVDARADELDLNRSQYFRKLAASDAGGGMRTKAKPQVKPPPKPLGSIPSVGMNLFVDGSGNALGVVKPLPEQPAQPKTQPTERHPSRKSKRG